MDHGLAGLDERGKVENGIKGFSFTLGRRKDVLKNRPVCHFSPDELHADRQQIAPAMAQVVKNDGLMPMIRQ
jgi:hypothetical protein